MALFGLLRLPLPVLALLALCAPSAADDDDASGTATVTTAPIFLPYYDEESWSLVRGSIISSNATASQTTYTIFCPTETPQACDLSLEFPFVVVEGPDTVDFHGTYTSTFIANLGCELDGKTAATCSGYSSLKSDYTNGLHTGPTEISWTSTFTGSDVEYGTLTMADIPKTTDDSLENTATAVSTPTVSSGISIPEATGTGNGDGDGEGAGANLRLDRRWAMVASLAGALGAGLIVL